MYQIWQEMQYLKIFIDGDSISENDLILKGSIVDLEVGNGLGNQIFDAPDLQLTLNLDEAKIYDYWIWTETR